MTQRLSRAELRSWFMMVGGMKTILNALDRQLRDEQGMTHDDYEILSRLHRAQGRSMRMSDLARDIGFSPSRLSHAMSRMEQEGWVRRTPSPSDGRVIEAGLTESGAAKVEDVSPEHLALVRRLVFDNLGQERAREVAESMDQIRRACTGREEPGKG